MTRDDLEQIYYLNRELKMWERELERLRGQSLVRSPVPDVVRGSGISDKVGDRGDKIIDLEARVKAKREEIQVARDDAVRYILGIPDSLTRMVIYYRCVSLMSWRRVAYEVGGGITKSGVRMIYTRFFEKL